MQQNQTPNAPSVPETDNEGTLGSLGSKTSNGTMQSQLQQLADDLKLLDNNFD